MTEQEWRHRFVQAVVEIITDECGLGRSIAFKLAFEDVDFFWGQMSSFNSPEDAARAAFTQMKA